MKFLCIDYGLERTGLATCDPEECLAYPLKTLHLSHFSSRTALLDAITHVAFEEGVEAVVLGLPLLEDGSDSLMTRQVRNVVQRLGRRIALPFYFMPELLSSEEAKADLYAVGRKGKKIKTVLDQQAAVRILQSFLALPHEQRRRV